MSEMSNTESKHNFVYMKTPQNTLNSYLVLCILSTWRADES